MILATADDVAYRLRADSEAEHGALGGERDQVARGVISLVTAVVADRREVCDVDEGQRAVGGGGNDQALRGEPHVAARRHGAAVSREHANGLGRGRASGRAEERGGDREEVEAAPVVADDEAVDGGVAARREVREGVAAERDNVAKRVPRRQPEPSSLVERQSAVCAAHGEH